MANSNPIKTTDTGNYPVYIIPKKYAGKILFITTTTELNKDDWNLDLTHALNIRGNPIDFNPDPDIKKQEIGICQELHNGRFALSSIATRIRNGAIDNSPPKVVYKLLFEANDEKIDDEFSFTSDETNPITFYTKITFKMEQ